MRMTEAQRKEWNDMKGGNSLCVCGHRGDGEGSQHHDTFQHGHGACTVPGCKCGKFTWVGWTPEAEAFLQRVRK